MKNDSKKNYELIKKYKFKPLTKKMLYQLINSCPIINLVDEISNDDDGIPPVRSVDFG